MLAADADTLVVLARVDAFGRVLAANALAQTLGVVVGRSITAPLADHSSRSFFAHFLARAALDPAHVEDEAALVFGLGDQQQQQQQQVVACRVAVLESRTEITVAGVPIKSRGKAMADPRLLVKDGERAVFDEMERSVIAIDVLGHVLYWNDAATALYGYRAEEMLGEQVSTITDTSAATFIYELMDTLRNGRIWSGSYPCIHKNGTPLPVRATDYPIFAADGKTLVGVVGISYLEQVDGGKKQNMPSETSHHHQHDTITATNQSSSDASSNGSDVIEGMRDSTATFVMLEKMSTTIIDCGNTFTRCIGRSPLGKDALGLFSDPEIADLEQWSATPVSKHIEITEHAEFANAVRNEQPGKFILTVFDSAKSARRCVTVDVKVPRSRDFILLLVTNISAEQKLYAALEKANAETLANHYKTKFLTHMSHELRTPLNGIAAETELLLCRFADKKKHADDDKEIVDSLRIISTCSQIQLGLINNLLDLRRLEEGKLTVSYSEVNLCETARNVMRVCGAMAHMKRISVSLVVEDEAQYDRAIVSDEMMVAEVLINYVGNAIKHCPEGSSVQIVLRTFSKDCLDPKAVIHIVDDGEGIPFDKQSQLFTPFSQFQQNAIGASGLGLSICREIAALLQGRVWYERREPRGSIFGLSFPLRYVDTSTSAPECEASFSSQKAEQQHHASKPTTDSFADMRILIAEDNKINQLVLVKTLVKLGANKTNICVVDDGLQALERVQLNHGAFDVILMDLSMPVMGGIESSRRIRELGCTTVIIAVTAHAMDFHREEAESAGIDVFLTKPIVMKQLQSCLAGLGELRSCEE